MENALWYFNVINTYIIFDYMKKTYGFKVHFMALNTAATIVFYLIHAHINSFHIASANIVADFVMINTFTFLFFKKRAGKFYFNVFFQIYLLSVDMILTGVSAIVNGMLFTKIQIDDMYIPYLTLNFVVLLLTYRKVIHMFCYDYIFFESKHNRRKLLFIIAAESGLVLLLSSFYHIYLASLFGIVMMFCIILINNRIFSGLAESQNRAKKIEEDNLIDAFTIELENIAECETNARLTLAEFFMAHSIESIKSRQSDAELIAHLEMMQSKTENVVNYECGNRTMNAIIANTISQARSNDIRLICDIDILNWDFIARQDIAKIMIALFSNAIEMVSHKKNLSIKARQKANYILITINCCCKTKIEKHFFRNTNKIKIRKILAEELIKANGGEIYYEILEEDFKITILLPTIKI